MATNTITNPPPGSAPPLPTTTTPSAPSGSSALQTKQELPQPVPSSGSTASQAQQERAQREQTDQKVYTYAVLGKALLIAAAITAAAFIILACIIQPLLAAGIAGSVALAILGFCFLDTKSAQEGFSAPYVNGQPLGIPRPGHNCWMNSLLQMLLFSPTIREQILKDGQFKDTPLEKQILHYLDAEVNQRTVAGNVDTQDLRLWAAKIGDLSNQISANALQQEDPIPVLSYILRKTIGCHTLIQKHTHANGKVVFADTEQPPKEEVFSLQMSSTVANPSFHTLFNGYFNYTTVEGGKVNRQLHSPPKDLFVHLIRFEGWGNNAQKISTPIQDIPINYTLGPEYIAKATHGVDYILESFVHHSGSLHKGHYTFYCRKDDGTWWHVNDERSVQVSEKDALKKLSEAYIVHWKKVEDVQSTGDHKEEKKQADFS